MTAFKSVATDDAHEGPLCTFIRWRCMHDAPELREARSMPFFSLACVQEGTFVHHSPTDDVLLHPGLATFQGPTSTYWVSHPYGLDRGCRIRLRNEVALEAVEALRPELAETIHSGRRQDAMVRQMPPALLLRLSILSRSEPGLFEADPLLFEETALEILTEVLQPPEATDLPRRADTLNQQRHWVQESRRLLARRYAENLRLEEIAHAVATSPFHLSRLFKREVGISLARYRNRLRLAVALERLAQGEEDLTSLALDLGYSSHSHFTRAFASECAVPPRQAREWLRGQGAPRFAALKAATGTR
jgi:AraC-like DNA-binding protein